MVSLGLISRGWMLGNARAISDDGRTIVGVGLNPLGLTESWVPRNPEPGTAMMFALLLGVGVLRAR
ncbi:MAG: hypothetical protein L6Q92_11100 [Phycisphaerae bacterium]|nr:hypothetical protein [Phycisphaerae bacterium]